MLAMIVLVSALLLLIMAYIKYGLINVECFSKNVPPGPKPWPIIGSLHLMASYTKYPFEVFTRLQKVYGPVFSIKLGVFNCVVISSEKDMKEVLQAKADHFDGRPDWRRYDLMFGGTRRNALAFCDFDKLQVARRKILRSHTFPSAGGDLWSRLDKVCQIEMGFMMKELMELCKRGEAIVDMKAVLMKATSNIFNDYFCSRDRKQYDDEAHNNYCENFDKVFWEVNTGRAVDFLPWLIQAPMKFKQDIKQWTGNVRTYVLNNLVDKEADQTEDNNLLNSLLEKVESDKKNKTDSDDALTEEAALYALEDVLGGHCAVTNFTIRVLIDVATRPAVQSRLREDIVQSLGSEQFGLGNKSKLVFLQSTFWETVRTTCSAIVPHVANRNTKIAGYSVPANSLIFVNNHHSHFSETYWDQPSLYKPERFLLDGVFKRPSHFSPFSFGKRSCMGYKMVEYVTSHIMANIFGKLEIKCSRDMAEQPGGILGLSPEPFYFTLKRLDSSWRRLA